MLSRTFEFFQNLNCFAPSRGKRTISTGAPRRGKRGIFVQRLGNSGAEFENTLNSLILIVGVSDNPPF
jgi:hypothetical protein